MPRWSSFDVAADRTLVQRLNEGDEGALGALYDAYAERLYDYCLTMTGEHKTAADIVHDTFIDAFRRAPRMRDQLRLRPWLYAAARRRCLQRGRARGLTWEKDGEFPETSHLELRELLEASLARLGFSDQEALLLAMRHGLRSIELGAALGLSPRRATARLARAQARLQTAVEAELLVLERRCAHGEQPIRAHGEPASAREPVDARELTGARELADAEAELEEHAEALESPSEEDAAESDAPSGVEVVLAAAHPQVRPQARRALPGTLRRTIRPRAMVRLDDSPASRVVEAEPLARTGEASSRRPAADCPSCLERGEQAPVALLVMAPAPVLPAALRHRVIHTGSDPELAGYRTDIVARGGTLTPDGLPSQPDVPSPVTRRWLFAGGGMAGALATALIAAVLMGPGKSIIHWSPLEMRPQPGLTEQRPPSGGVAQGQQPGQGQGPGDGRGGGGGSSDSPQLGGQRKTVPSPTPHDPGTPPPSPSPPVQPKIPGQLTAAPGKVELYGTKTARVVLTAHRGPVTWSSATSSGQVTVIPSQGSLPKGSTTELTIKLSTGLVNLPGQSTLTFTDTEGRRQEVTVVWGISLL
ncbi:RNA polymerase sigma factor [Spirillospora sp. NPDC048911]|uniref:RNA polymerase sigma factor n=1 Tax=Spirillospora sp. NPDC048911 TaxID=3364527 RepID=UPI00370FABC0